MPQTGKERRKFFRHPLNIPIKLRIEDGGSPLDANSNDISLGGLNFSWPKKLPKGTFLTIAIPVKEKIFDVHAKVVYCKEDRKTARFFTGVSFTDFPSAFKARLAEEVLQIMEYQKSISKELGYKISENDAAERWVKNSASDFPPIKQ